MDDDLSSESDVVETCPRKRTHINLEVPANSHGRPLVRRHSPTENQRSTGAGQQSLTQNDLHKSLPTELAWQHRCSLGAMSSTSEPQTPSDSASATSEGQLPRKFCKESLSTLRIFLFMMLGNFIYTQKSKQANLGLPRPGWRR